MFRQATKTQSKLRMTINGPAGSGKTYTALRFAHALIAYYGGKIALVDTEHGSASKYVGEAPDGTPWAFDTLQLTQFSPDRYTEAVEAAGKMGYTVLVIDSLSHAWEGAGGALEIKQKMGDSWSTWRHVTPLHNRMINAMLQSPCHIITTMRSRMEYVQEQDERTGKITIRKVGMAPVQRPGIEYEFDILCDMDWMHVLTVSKSRCAPLSDITIDKPGAAFMEPIIAWLTDGVLQPEPPTYQPAVPVINLDALITAYGVDAVMAANNGVPPSTPEEIQSVFEKLVE